MTTTLLLVVGTAWVVFALARATRPKPTRPTILTHRLSDRDQIVTVEKDGQFWVGLFTETPDPPTEERTTSTPDSYPKFRWN